MEKSHVGMTQYVCPVTGKTWQGNEILLDKRLRKSLDRYNTMGYKVCPEVQEQIDKDFLPLVECDPTKSDTYIGSDGFNKSNPQDAYRTGRVFYIKREAFKRIFNVPEVKQKFAYIDIETGEYLRNMEENLKK